MTLIDQTEGTTPTTHHRPSRLRHAGSALAVTLLVASAVYGFTQHQHGVALTKERDTALHSLSGTRKVLHSTKADLSSTRSDLDGAQADLATANDQLGTCADVSKATMELFNSTDSLLNALTNYPDGLSDLDSASRNIDRVTRLMQDNGFSTIQDFLDACKGTGGTGI